MDIVFLIIVGISILMGIIKGFIRELFSLIFLILGIVLAYLFYKDVGAIFMKYLSNKDIANFLGFTGIFTSILIVGALFTYLIRKIFTVGPLKAIDRILGGIFGLLRGILIIIIIILVLQAYPSQNNLLNKSKFSPYMIGPIQTILTWLPKKVSDKLKFTDKTAVTKGRQDDREKNN